MIYPGIRSEIGSAMRTAHDRMMAVVSLEAQFAAFMASLTGPKVALDPSVAASRYQEVAGTTPASTAGQTVGKLLDISGAANHVGQATAAFCPLYQTDGTLHWLQLDGSNDSLYSLANFDASSTNKITVIAGVLKASDAVAGLIAGLGAGTPGSFALMGPDPNSLGANYRTEVRGDAAGATALRATSFASSHTAVISTWYDLAGAARDTEVFMRVNGVVPTLSAGGAGAAGAGNFSSAVLSIGRLSNVSLPFNGRLYGLLIIGRLLTAAELTLCERWMASKTGVTL